MLALAARRHGVVTFAELAAAGLSRRAVQRRARRGWLVRMHRGVYRVGPIAAPRAREMAALLACGPDAILSHDSAADVWGIRPAPDGPVHVTLAGRDARHPGIRVHRIPDLPAAARTRHAGLPLTTAARTLADLRLPAGEQARACEQAEILGLVPRTAGAPGITRSEAERRLLRLIRAAGLPAPRTNVRVGDYEVDCHWPDARLVVEVDGFAYHASRAAFERDRRRDADLVAAGLRVVRFTWRQLVHEPEAVVARLAVLLA